MSGADSVFEKNQSSDDKRDTFPLAAFIAKNPRMLEIIERARLSSPNTCVLIVGEDGVGKKTLARKLCSLSPRGEKPFLEADACDLDEDFFSHSRMLPLDGGTILLDEISLLSPDIQNNLLHLIKEGSAENGSGDRLDIRVIATTSRDLTRQCESGLFSSDLYYLLSVQVFSVPALRDRTDELDDFCALFLEYFNKKMHKAFQGFSPAAKEAIQSYMWVGNITELKNAVERAFILGTPPLIRANDLRIFSGVADSNFSEELSNCAAEAASNTDRRLKTALDDFKRAYITTLLRDASWNQTKVAKILDVQRTYIAKLIKDLDIPRHG